MIILSAKNKMDKQYLEEIGKRIETHLEKQKLRPSEFAKIINCSERTVYKMINGEDLNTKYYRSAINAMNK